MDSPLSHNTDGLLHNVSWQKHEAGWWEERRVSNVTCLETFGSPQNMPRCAGEKQQASFYTPHLNKQTHIWKLKEPLTSRLLKLPVTALSIIYSFYYHVEERGLMITWQRHWWKTYLQTKVDVTVSQQFTVITQHDPDMWTLVLVHIILCVLMVSPSPLPFCVAFACSPCACVGLLLLDLSRDIHIEEAALRTLKELHLCPCLSQILAAIYTAKALSSLEVMQWKLNLLESVQKRALRMITRSSATLLQLLALQRREQAAIQLLKDMIHT